MNDLKDITMEQMATTGELETRQMSTELVDVLSRVTTSIPEGELSGTDISKELLALDDKEPEENIWGFPGNEKYQKTPAATVPVRPDPPPTNSVAVTVPVEGLYVK